MDLSRRYCKPKVMKKRKDLNKYKLRSTKKFKLQEENPSNQISKSNPIVSKINRDDRLTVKRGLFDNCQKSRVAFRDGFKNENVARLNEDLDAIIPSAERSETLRNPIQSLPYESNNNVVTSPPSPINLWEVPSTSNSIQNSINSPKRINDISKDRSSQRSKSLSQVDLLSPKHVDSYPRTRAFVNAQRERLKKYGTYAFELSCESEIEQSPLKQLPAHSFASDPHFSINKYIELITGVEKSFVQVKQKIFKKSNINDYFDKFKNEIWNTFENRRREISEFQSQNNNLPEVLSEHKHNTNSKRRFEYSPDNNQIESNRSILSPICSQNKRFHSENPNIYSKYIIPFRNEEPHSSHQPCSSHHQQNYTKESQNVSEFVFSPKFLQTPLLEEKNHLYGSENQLDDYSPQFQLFHNSNFDNLRWKSNRQDEFPLDFSEESSYQNQMNYFNNIEKHSSRHSETFSPILHRNLLEYELQRNINNRYENCITLPQNSSYNLRRNNSQENRESDLNYNLRRNNSQENRESDLNYNLRRNNSQENRESDLNYNLRRNNSQENREIIDSNYNLRRTNSPENRDFRVSTYNLRRANSQENRDFRNDYHLRDNFRFIRDNEDNFHSRRSQSLHQLEEAREESPPLKLYPRKLF